MDRPVIGVTMDVNETDNRYQVNRPYVLALVEAGAVPVLLPPVDAGLMHEQVKRVDGVLFIGGRDYISKCDDGPRHEKVEPMPVERETFDFQLFADAQQARLPSLCICAGIQLAAAHYGAKLIQDIPSEYPGAIEHSVKQVKDVHEVSIEKGSLLYRITGEEKISVNSTHHQGVIEDSLPDGIKVTSRACDGMVESLEIIPGGPVDNGAWFLATQWHPERLTDREPHAKIFKAFVEACRTKK